MKKIILLFTILLICSCHSEAKKILLELPTELEKQQQNRPGQSEGEKIAAILKEKAPLSEEQLRAAFPEHLRDLKRDENLMVLGQQVMGAFGNKNISMSVTDAAGSGSNMVVPLIDNYSMPEEETDRIKIIKKEREGQLTTTEYRPYDKDCSMSFIYDNRFWVILKARGLDPEELWQAFDLGALKTFKEANR